MKARKNSHNKKAGKAIAEPEKVSQNCDTGPIAFRVFVSQAGSAVVQKCIDGLDPAVIQEFKSRIRFLMNTPQPDWAGAGVKKLTGHECLEIKLKVHKKEHRPLGIR